jgi:hypothetical protein
MRGVDLQEPPAPAAEPSPVSDKAVQDAGAGAALTATTAIGASPRRRSIHWLFEGLLIVVSVALGFSLTQWGERRHEQELAERMLLGVRAEVERNRVMLEPFLAFHVAWRDAFDLRDASASAGSARDLLWDARPPLQPDMTAHMPLLRRAAWDTALSTGALRLVDYDLAAGISEIYSMQAYAASVFPPMFSETTFFDPTARVAATRMAQTTMHELVFAEQSLLALYDTHLPSLRSAVGGE